MKKTFPVNINGTIFYIDEDAYNLLNTYLQQLRQAFPGSEGKEIVADIEARIAELFSEIIATGSNVITIDDVNSVIEKMGRPAELSDQSDEWSEESHDPQSTPPPFPGVAKKLYRNMNNKVFGGVLSGVACYFGWNTNILRLLVIVLALCTYLWPLILAYLIAWMVIPAAVTPRQILEMKGTPVTIGNVGQTIIGTSDSNVNETGDTVQSILSAFGKIILIFLGTVAMLIVFGMLAMFISALCGLIMYWGWNDLDLLSSFDMFEALQHPVMGAVGIITLALCIAIPCIAIVWATCSVVFKTKGISKPILISGLILEVLLVIATVILLSVANISNAHYGLHLSQAIPTLSSTLGSAALSACIHF